MRERAGHQRLEGAPSVERAPDGSRRVPVWAPSAPLTAGAVLHLQRAAGNLAVSRLLDPVDDQWVGQAPAAQAQPELPEEEIIDAETSAIAETLDSFRQVPISVFGPTETAPTEPGIDTPPASMAMPFMLVNRMKTVTVHAAYFINSGNAMATYHNEAGFKKVAAALKGKSLIESGGHRYSVGNAVMYGKSTPADVRAFVEEALQQDVIKTYAHSLPAFNSQFPAGQTELIDLPDATLQQVVQQWVLDKGVGVDCSGFVLQAAIAVREKIKAVAKEKGCAVPAEYQGDIAHEERSAASFASGSARSAPTDIQLGDPWVIGNHHVRIVASTPLEVDGQIQFDADESYGDVLATTVGPIQHTWRTHSTTAFNTMLRLKDGGDPAKKADYEAKPQGNHHHFYPIA